MEWVRKGVLRKSAGSHWERIQKKIYKKGGNRYGGDLEVVIMPVKADNYAGSIP